MLLRAERACSGIAVIHFAIDLGQDIGGDLAASFQVVAFGRCSGCVVIVVVNEVQKLTIRIRRRARAGLRRRARVGAIDETGLREVLPHQNVFVTFDPLSTWPSPSPFPQPVVPDAMPAIVVVAFA